MTKTDKIKIVIADKQYLICKALEAILKDRFNISGIVYSKSELLNKIACDPPDLIIVDFLMFDFDSIADLKELKKQIRGIIVLSNEVSHSEFVELSDAGIENILLKTTDESELFRAIECCLKGRKYFSEEILELVIEKNQRKNTFGKSCHLTQSEMDIVKLIAEGLTTKQMAAKKFLSFHTIMTHRKNIFRKTGVKSISELVMFAVKAGWIDNIEYYI
jgi:DNA-binding NarL/FixJ family response regulator